MFYTKYLAMPNIRVHTGAIKKIVAPLNDIQMFYINYLTMHKVHIQAVIVWLCACTGDNTLAKARGLSPVHTQKLLIV